MVALLAWLALAFELSGNWLIGDKRRWGFVVKVLGSLAWLAVAVLSGIHGLIAASILGGLISVRNFVHWRRRSV